MEYKSKRRDMDNKHMKSTGSIIMQWDLPHFVQDMEGDP